MKGLVQKGRWWRRLALAGSLLFVSGCGDGYTYELSAGGFGPSDGLSDLDGSLIELARLSSRCSLEAGDHLVALVGSHMEFPGEDVTGLKSPCGGGPEVRVDIDLDGHRIVYDFAKVSAPGHFPDVEFEGFVVTDMFHTVPDIRGVSIDRSLTTLLVPDTAVSFDAHSVSINLAGMDFDGSSFVKLDLVFESDLADSGP